MTHPFVVASYATYGLATCVHDGFGLMPMRKILANLINLWYGYFLEHDHYVLNYEEWMSVCTFVCCVNVHTYGSRMKSVESYMLMEIPIKLLSTRETERERKSQWHMVAHLFTFVNDINAVECSAKECAILSIVFFLIMLFH